MQLAVLFVSTALLGLVSLAVALVLTAPVLMIVDSSTLERKESKCWRRVAASYFYFGVLGVLLWEGLQRSPVVEEAMVEWSTGVLTYVVFVRCFALVYLFSVVVTTIHAHQKRKISPGVIVASTVPIILYALALQHISITALALWLRRTVTRMATADTKLASLSFNTSNISNASSYPAHNSAAQEDGPRLNLYQLVEATASHALLAAGAAAVAFMCIFCVIVAFATEWRGYARIAYCMMLTTMLFGHGKDGGYESVTEWLVWLQVWALMSWAYWLFEIILLLILPVAWVLFGATGSQKAAGGQVTHNAKPSRSVALFPSVIYMFLAVTRGWASTEGLT